MHSKTLYKALLYCYPAAFRHEYGNQMLLMFAEQMGHARRAGGWFAQAVLWSHATLDALIIAPKEHWHVIIQDLRYALRVMAASPGFTAVAILSLALGIGANTAIFNLWNGLLNSPLPGVQKPEELVMLSNPDDSGRWTGRWDGRADGPRSWLTYGEFEELRDHAKSFSVLMASESSLDRWRVRFEGGEPEEVRGRLVSSEFFQTLGVNAAIGRGFAAGGNEAAAVISHNYWQRRFGGRTDVNGKTLTVGTAVLTVIGVAPAGFIGETAGQQPDLWLPLHMQPSVEPGTDWLHDTPPSKVMWLNVFGRLKPGVTPSQAESESNAIFRGGLETFYGPAALAERGRDYMDQRLKLRPGGRGASAKRSEISTSLTAMLAGVGLLLLIACANLANLLLARGAARKPEVALRLSLGASRGRIIRQLVTENVALAVAGGAAAICVAYFIHGALVRMIAQSDARFQMSFVLDPLLFAFVVTATLMAALLFGVLPAWQVTREGDAWNLKEQSRGAIGALGQIRSGRFLVSLQLALSLPLLFGAGLLARTVYNLQRADLGYSAERLVLVRVDLHEAADNAVRRGRMTQELLGQFQRIPGVHAASFSGLGLFSGGNSSLTVEVEGYAPKGDNDRGSSLDVVGPGYFSALGVPIAVGREIQESDHAGAPVVCVINEAFAKRFFSGRNAIGMRLTSIGDNTRTAYEVVGVAKDAHTANLRNDVEPRFFVSAQQVSAPPDMPTFLIRTEREAGSILAAARKTVQDINPSLEVVSAKSIKEQMALLTAQDRTTAQLAIAFGCVALALTAIGLYGVLSYGVTRRTGEIAIRMALGARPSGVIGMILGETIGIVIVGMVLGGGLAYGASQLITSQLYGVAPGDPITLIMATGLLVLTALSAAYLPARRASRLDPMVALRQE